MQPRGEQNRRQHGPRRCTVVETLRTSLARINQRTSKENPVDVLGLTPLYQSAISNQRYSTQTESKRSIPFIPNISCRFPNTAKLPPFPALAQHSPVKLAGPLLLRKLLKLINPLSTRPVPSSSAKERRTAHMLFEDGVAGDRYQRACVSSGRLSM